MAQHLPEDEREAVERHVREYDRIGEDLRVVERELARDALSDADVKRLMTIPGIDMVVAVGLTAAIGTIKRFKTPDQLVSYIGLNPSVHQSGEGRAHHGRITKQGRTHARTMLVEAARQAVRGPRPEPHRLAERWDGQHGRDPGGLQADRGRASGRYLDIVPDIDEAREVGLPPARRPRPRRAQWQRCR